MDGFFDQWLGLLEARHLADLTFPEVSRALRALSSTYVERRGRMAQGGALAGNGKRAAFALFYGPLHYLLVSHIARALPRAGHVHTLVDLGCGTGASGLAWAHAVARPPRLLGCDRHPWAVEEARWAYRALAIRGEARVGDVARVTWPAQSALLAAFTVNELDEGARAALLGRFLQHAQGGGRVLIVEPIAGFVAPWWGAWRQAFETHGGRADEWRLRATLPPLVAKLDRAAGLNHREITGRSLWM